MTSKQRAFLRKMASSITPVVSVGKSSITPEVVQSISEALEARELIKVNVLENCPDDVRYVAETSGERARAEVVQVIGRKFVLYRPKKDKPVIELPK